MNNDVLEQLFYGKIAPWEQQPEDVEEFRRLSRELSLTRSELNDRIDDDTENLLERYLAIHADLENLHSLEAFKYGFRMGIQIMLDVYSTL